MSGKSKIKLESLNGIPARKCSGCHVLKVLDDYHYKGASTRSFLGYDNFCKECISKRNKENYVKDRENQIKKSSERGLISKYGISIDDYHKLYQLQDGRCLICKNYFEKLHIDHCHSSEKVRGLLCQNCNMGLGHFKENTLYLINAIVYLKNFKQ